MHRELVEELHRELVTLAAAPAADGTSPSAEALLEAVLRRDAPLLPPEDRAEVRRLLAERTVGLGPLESLFDDPEIDEIMVSGTRPVWVERRGRIEVTGVRFGDEQELLHAIERMLAGAGRRVDRADPLCDARLPDGKSACAQSSATSLRRAIGNWSPSCHIRRMTLKSPQTQNEAGPLGTDVLRQ